MLKKLTVFAAAAAVLAGGATAADAAVRNINIYGASAQYLFWNDAADNFLATRGCSNISQSQNADVKNGITTATGCSAYGGDDVTIRYSAKASYDGITSMLGVDHPNAITACTNKYERPMCTGNPCTATSCQDVTLGASDVAAGSFSQISNGALNGVDGGAVQARNFTANPVNSTGLTTYNPLVVPFSPFVKNDVTMLSCDSGANAGEMCTVATATANCGASVGCTAKPLANISREMMVNIFSGTATKWNDFGAAFPNEFITLCLRHAGSGTHATFDHAVMNQKWGKAVVTNELNQGTKTTSQKFFHDSASNQMKCINGNGGIATTFAIGYADADQSLSSYTNVYQPKYAGSKPSRENIRNGLYDYWSAQWLYESPSEPNYATTHPVILDLIAFASVPANIPGTKAAYWAAKNEMRFTKSNDKVYPTTKVAPTAAQTP